MLPFPSPGPFIHARCGSCSVPTLCVSVSTSKDVGWACNPQANARAWWLHSPSLGIFVGVFFPGSCCKPLSLSSGIESQGGSGELEAGESQSGFFRSCLQPDAAPAGDDILHAMHFGGTGRVYAHGCAASLSSVPSKTLCSLRKRRAERFAQQCEGAWRMAGREVFSCQLCQPEDLMQ